MEIHEDIVIVGAGIAGLTTALGLHRLGIRSVVLESSDALRITGFALTMWPNAWRALDAVGIGDLLRPKSVQIQGLEVTSRDSSREQAPKSDHILSEFEVRCLRRKDLLETLERELPEGTIKYSSAIVSIEESGNLKLVHLADGSVYTTKVLIGCDGVNSIVAKWLGLANPVSAARSAIRGFVEYPEGHGFEPKINFCFGGGVRYGFIPCDDKSIYWFCTFNPSLFEYDEDEHNPLKLKQFVVSNILDAVPRHVSDIVARTNLDCISCARLKLRVPWNVLLGNIAKNNVCVVGDALHPMTPDIGQGGCSSLEDSVVLVRCLGEAMSTKSTGSSEKRDDDELYVKIKIALQKYAKERRWRSFSLIGTTYVVGMIQESDAKVMSFLRRHTIGIAVRMARFDCGQLIVS